MNRNACFLCCSKMIRGTTPSAPWIRHWHSYGKGVEQQGPAVFCRYRVHLCSWHGTIRQGREAPGELLWPLLYHYYHHHHQKHISTWSPPLPSPSISLHALTGFVCLFNAFIENILPPPLPAGVLWPLGTASLWIIEYHIWSGAPPPFPISRISTRVQSIFSLLLL